MGKHKSISEYILHLESIDNTTLGKHTVIDVLKSIQKGSAFSSKPSKLKRGDVFICNVGNKNRPVVVISTKNSVVYGITLSTTNDCLNLYDGQSRFFGESFLGKGVVTAHEQFAIDNFIGVYDNPRVLKKAIEEMKKEIINF